MPDITACLNRQCTIRQTCFRYRCIHSEQQSVTIFKVQSERDCQHYWPISKGPLVSEPLSDFRASLSFK